MWILRFLSLSIFSLAASLLLTASLPLMAREIRISDRVFLVKDRSGSSLEFQMIVNAGAADEAGGEVRGLAHYLEHLILVGRNPENKDIAIRFFPEAVSNGWTNQVATVYWHRIPAREGGPRADLEKFFGFYAARLRDFNIPEEEAIRERNVVLQEHDWRYGANGASRFIQKLDRALLPNHPLGQWTIGSRETIRQLTLADAKAFHHRWYQPNNVWFVIRGDVDPALLKEISDKALGALSPAVLPPHATSLPPKITARQNLLTETDRQITQPQVFYKKLIHLDDEDELAGLARLSVLANFLGSQLPGSLHEALVDRAKVSTSAPYIGLTRLANGTYLLSIIAENPAEDDPKGQKLLAAIMTYVQGLGGLDISDRNIERMRKRLLDQRKTADEIPEQVFQRLVGWLARGDQPDDLNRLPEKIAAVGKSDLLPLLAAFAGPGAVAAGTLNPNEEAKP